jgi:hypothetical protein
MVKTHAPRAKVWSFFHPDPLLLGASIQAVVLYAATRDFVSASTFLKAVSGKALQSLRSLLLELYGSAFRWYHLVTIVSMQPRHRLLTAAPLIL